MKVNEPKCSRLLSESKGSIKLLKSLGIDLEDVVAVDLHFGVGEAVTAKIWKHLKYNDGITFVENKEYFLVEKGE